MIRKLYRIGERNPDLLHGTAMHNDYIVIIMSTQNWGANIMEKEGMRELYMCYRGIRRKVS